MENASAMDLFHVEMQGPHPKEIARRTGALVISTPLTRWHRRHLRGDSLSNRCQSTNIGQHGHSVTVGRARVAGRRARVVAGRVCGRGGSRRRICRRRAGYSWDGLVLGAFRDIALDRVNQNEFLAAGPFVVEPSPFQRSFFAEVVDFLDGASDQF